MTLEDTAHIFLGKVCHNILKRINYFDDKPFAYILCDPRFYILCDPVHS